MFIDTHCHISKEYYDNIDNVILDSKNNNVKKIIISGCEKESIDESIEISNKYENVYLTIGFHPDQVDIVDSNDLEKLKKQLISCKKIVGIGEIGLDYYYDKSKKEEQQILFRKQLEIAEVLNLPVVIHSRDAVSDTINILKDYKVHGVIHCFSGSLEVANIYIKMGYKLGIGGVVTFKNSNLPETLKNIDLENIVLETDSPYLTPHPYRGEKNSSKYIPIIAEKLSTIYNKDINYIAKKTTENAKNVFTKLV